MLSEVEDVLSHRLRAVDCRLDVDEASAAVEIAGAAQSLAHVLVNVVDNAIGAYEEQDRRDARIEVRARRTGDTVVVSVRDHAGGVPAEFAERVFDEMFTTKEPGKGTGLGLWIARNVVERSFRGTLEIVAVEGPGACFVATLRDAGAPASIGGEPAQAAVVGPASEPASRP